MWWKVYLPVDGKSNARGAVPRKVKEHAHNNSIDEGTRSRFSLWILRKGGSLSWHEESNGGSTAKTKGLKISLDNASLSKGDIVGGLSVCNVNSKETICGIVVVNPNAIVMQGNDKRVNGSQ